MKWLNKKTFAAIASLFISLPVMAASFTPPEPEKDTSQVHFYAGGQLGANALQMKIKATTLVSPTSIFQNNNYVGIEGFEGGLFAGVAWQDEMFYVAGEIHFDGSTNKQNYQFQIGTETNNFSLKNKYNTGISFIPGIYLNNNTMIYLRAAAVFAKFKQSTNGDGGAWVSPNTFSTTKNGWRGGVGIQADIDEDISIRLEYDYTRYSGFTNSGASEVFGNDMVNASYKPRSHTALAGLVYRFKTI